MTCRRDPLAFLEAEGRALCLPGGARDGVLVNADAGRTAFQFLAQDIGPRGVAVAGDHFRPGLSGCPQESLVIAVQAGVVVGLQVAAAAPQFVADAEVGDFERLFVSVPGTQPGQGRAAVRCHVLDPIGHLLHGAGADIAVDVGLGAQHVDQVEEFVGADGVDLVTLPPLTLWGRRFCGPTPSRQW